MTTLHGLYAITDEQLIPEHKFKQAIESTLMGGSSIIQYRDKSEDSKKRQRQAEQLCQLCKQYNAVSIINDDIELALSVNANGVHLGKNDVPVNQARQILGDDAIIGVSCYNDISLAQKAEKNTANYVAFGAMFPSMTKPEAIVASPDIISLAKSKLKVPICIIGGISSNNIGSLVQQGVDMTAVVSGIFAGSNIQHSTELLNQYYSSDSTSDDS